MILLTDPSYLPWPLTPEDLIIVSKHTCRQPVKSHRHDFIEMVFISQGSCKHTYLNTEVTLIRGDFFIVVPHETHAYTVDSETVIYNCLFYPQALGEDYKMIREVGGIFDFFMVEPFFRQEVGKQLLMHAPTVEASYIEELLNRMVDEQTQRKSGYQVIQKANLITLIVMLARIYEQTNVSNLDVHRSKRDLLIKALMYVEQHLGDDMKVDNIAAKAFLSPDYFRRIFKESIGMTPIEYINNMRIKKAVDLLREKRYSISEVAQIVGITDTNYFSRIFHSVIGCSPSDFLKKQ